MMDNNQDLIQYTWSARQLAKAMSFLAYRAGFTAQSTDEEKNIGYYGDDDEDSIDSWITANAKQIGIESQAVELSYAELEQKLPQIGPALIRLSIADQKSPRFLAVLKGSKQWMTLITPPQNQSAIGRYTTRRIPFEQLREILTYHLEAPLAPPIETLLTQAGIKEQRRADAKAAILREQLRAHNLTGFWILRLSPGDDFLKQIRHARIPEQILTLLGANLLTQLTMLIGWWVIGRGALVGHFEWVWISAWALLLFTAIPFQLIMVGSESLLFLSLGRLFKQRLLHGVLQLHPEEIRTQGAGQFLGLVMETATLESLALAGGLTAVLAILQLLLAMGVLAMGAAGWLHLILVSGWLIITGGLCWHYYLRSYQWITVYRKITNDLVERMVGHRTRLAQENPAHWHDKEDELLADYYHTSQQMDQINLFIRGVVGRGWLIVGFLGLAYTFIVTPTDSAQIAVSIGGILLISQYLNQFVTGISSIIDVIITWQQVGPLFQAASRDQQPATTTYISPQEIYKKQKQKQKQQPILTASNLTFRYQPEATPILQNCNFTIYQKERILLEGPSGGGKSTLAALISGLRQPETGQMQLWGIEQQRIGMETWRKKIVAAPQFHENHVFTETFAFNLLMGRRWPPQASDLKEAETICQELGLSKLLQQMPAGFQQMVGESGWQLSHGERSRLYIARALLQQADIIILDESFAALDPENLKHALQCVLKRASTLIVIAHP
jgi:ATP-binding cassette subfamily B protein